MDSKISQYPDDVSILDENDVRRKKNNSLTILQNFLRVLLKKGVLTWLVLAVIWSIAALFYPPTFFPGIVQTLVGSQEIILDGTLFQFVLISAARVYTGWLFGLVLGIPVGLFVGRSDIVRELVEPFINFFRFVPAIAFLTLFIMWFGVGEESKVILIMYSTFFIVVINTAAGVISIDKNKIQAARSLGANERQIFFYVIIPAIIPQIFTGVRLGMGSAFTSIVAAEMLAAKEGIGYLIFTSRLYFHTDWIFIGLVTLGFMGFFSDKFLRFIGTVFLKKYGVKTEGNFGK
jgi:ABC-type nitrate/sulfonate/bicarbonate transport system permease component